MENSINTLGYNNNWRKRAESLKRGRKREESERERERKRERKREREERKREERKREERKSKEWREGIGAREMNGLCATKP